MNDSFDQELRLVVKAIQPAGDNRFFFELRVGEEIFTGHIVESGAGDDIRLINFEEPFFSALASSSVFGKNFTINFWAFKNGDAQPFPWEIGECSQGDIERALSFKP